MKRVQCSAESESGDCHDFIIWGLWLTIDSHAALFQSSSIPVQDDETLEVAFCPKGDMGCVSTV